MLPSAGLRHSFKARVTLILLLIFVAGLWLFSWYASFLLQHDVRQRVGAAQNAAVVALAQHLNDQVSLRLRALDAAAKSVTAAQQLTPDALQSALQANTVLPTLFNAGILVFEEDGAVLANAPLQSERLTQRIPLSSSDKTTLNELTHAIVAPLRLGTLQTVPQVMWVSPLPTVGGLPKRWLAGVVALRGDSFLDHLSESTADTNSRYLIVSTAHRTVVAASQSQGVLAHTSAPGDNAIVDSAMTASPGTRIVTADNGQTTMLSVAAVPAAQWQLSIHLPWHAVMAPIAQAQQQLWLAATLLSLLAGGLVWWALHRQLKPLRDASATLAQMSGAQTPAQTKTDEIGVLMARINALLAQIRARELELDVQSDELSQINQQLQAILQHVPQLVWLKDLQGRYITCNARFESFFDLPIASVQGRSDNDLFPPNQAEQYRQDEQRCLQLHRLDTVQHWLQPKSHASQVLLEISRIALRDAQGRAQAVLGIGQDVTERWRQSQFAQLRSKVLELVVQDGALPVLLQTLADGLRSLHADWSCALMLTQETPAPVRLRVMASAGLDDDFVQALDGLVVNDGGCSCATAALTGKCVVVDDIAQSANASDYRTRAQNANLGASWSQPLFDLQHKVIGVFSVYQQTTQPPDPQALELLVQLARLAEIALERSRSGERLRASEKSFRALTENTHEAVLVHRKGTVVYANPAALRLFGAQSPDQLLHKSTHQLIAPDFLAQQTARMRALERGETLDSMVESRFLRLDGSPIDVEVQGTAVVFDGQPAIHVSIRDITHRAETHRKLQLAAIGFEHALEGILITTASGNIVDTNASFTRITQFQRQDVLGKNPRLLQSGRHDAAFYQAMWHSLLTKGLWSGEVSNRRKDGQVYTQMLHISAVRGAQGEVLHYVGLFSDITTRKIQEERLNYLAHFDTLTGLPNRSLHADRLRQAMANVMRRHKKLGVAFVDLDGFKAVNDAYGHDAGDQVLITVANRMRQALREVDTLSRIGGDEFAAIIVDIDYESDCDVLLQRLLAAANEPVRYKGQTLRVSASVGVTFYPQHEDTTPDQLMRQADQAMYKAKHLGKNQLQLSGFADLPE